MPVYFLLNLPPTTNDQQTNVLGEEWGQRDEILMTEESAGGRHYARIYSDTRNRDGKASCLPNQTHSNFTEGPQ